MSMPNPVDLDVPMVSIGVPVYNEAKFIALALNSLRAQDYPRIEIIVSDNASTDGTAQVCEQIAAVDPRIRVIRAQTNEGSTANFQRCLDAAKGELFMWAGGHDLWSENLVTECVSGMMRIPSAVVAIPESQWIDTSSQAFASGSSIIDTRDMPPLARAFVILWANMHGMYGVMRTAILRRCGPVPNYAGADLILLLRLVLHGDFVPVPNALWSRRVTRANEDFKSRQKRYVSSEFGRQQLWLDRVSPLARLPLEILKCVWSSTSLARADKIAFTVALPWILPARYLVARRRVI